MSSTGGPTTSTKSGVAPAVTRCVDITFGQRNLSRGHRGTEANKTEMATAVSDCVIELPGLSR